MKAAHWVAFFYGLKHLFFYNIRHGSFACMKDISISHQHVQQHYVYPSKRVHLDKHSFMSGKIIHIDPEILGGTPVFFGTRVPIKNLFDYLETGDSIETFLNDFEGVQKEQVIKLLEMSQKLIETSTNILNENFA